MRTAVIVVGDVSGANRRIAARSGTHPEIMLIRVPSASTYLKCL
jgi:hypothetical protein